MQLDQLRQDMAMSVAAENGWATPSTPKEYLATLDRAYPGTGDPFEYIDIKATDETHDYEEDDHW